MAEIDDLKTQMGNLTTAVSNVATELKGVSDALVALKGQPTIDPADVAAIATQAGALAASLQAAADAAKAETGV